MTKTMIVLLAAGALLLGCNKDDGGGKDGKTGSAGESIGVAECDDYIKKMEACFAKDPASKAAMEPGLKTMRDSWRAAAAQGGAQKDALKQGCTAAAAGIPANCK